jgi:hypothetical protein
MRFPRGSVSFLTTSEVSAVSRPISAGRLSKRFDSICTVSETTSTKQAVDADVEDFEPSQREHARWHFDEAIADKLTSYNKEG